MQKYSDLIKTLLEKRNILDPEKIEIFLSPDYERDLHDPFLMKDMEKACVRIFEAIEAQERIVIYADYDADGIPGAVIFNDLFRKVNFTNYEIYIPQRNSEGYGLNLDSIEDFKKKNTKLLITVDLGITAIAEVAQMQVEGIEIIITDHHLPKQKIQFVKNSSAFALGGKKTGDPRRQNFSQTEFMLPSAYAILNPKTDNYPEKMLCGAGVVFKLVQAFVKKYGEYFKIHNGWEKWSLDMAGLATLSDMVPLTGENRALAFFGLKVLRKSKRPGFQKLLAKIKLDQRHLNEEDLAFMLTPRLNAASRMDNPMRAFELLSTDDEIAGGVLAEHLSKINDDRKIMVANIMREVKKKLEKREIKEIIVIGNPEWRIGILGLVAGKISDEYKKPVFVWGKDENDMIKGSCRSCGKISVSELMNLNSKSFLEFGGHEMAGGFTVAEEKIHFLEDELINACKNLNNLKKQDLKEVQGLALESDFSGDLSLVTIRNWREIEKLSPFGLENPKPVFYFSNIVIQNIKKFGKNGSGEHLEISFIDENKNKAVAISFFSNSDSFSRKIEEGQKVNLLANFDLSFFRGKEELRLRIIDII